MNETNDNENRTETTTTTTTSTQKPYQTDEHLLKLQQKITKELLNSNLEQKEMNELQVIKIIYALFLFYTLCEYIFMFLFNKYGKHICFVCIYMYYMISNYRRK